MSSNLTTHILYNKKVFFIGRFASCNRKDVVAKLEIAGGKCRDKLTPLVDIVVIGENPANNAIECVLERAKELQSSKNLEILSETEFLQLV